MTITWSNVFPILKTPKVDIFCEISSHECWRVGNSHLPCPAGGTLINAAQNFVGLHCCEGTPMAAGFSTAAAWSSSTKVSFLLTRMGVEGHSISGAWLCIAFCRISWGFCQPVEVPPDDSPPARRLLPPARCGLLHHSGC